MQINELARIPRTAVGEGFETLPYVPQVVSAPLCYTPTVPGFGSLFPPRAMTPLSRLQTDSRLLTTDYQQPITNHHMGRIAIRPYETWPAEVRRRTLGPLTPLQDAV